MKVLALNLYPEKRVADEGLFGEVLEYVRRGYLSERPQLLILPHPILELNVRKWSPLKRLALELYKRLVRSHSKLSAELRELRTLDNLSDLIASLSPVSLLKKVSYGGIGFSLIFGVRFNFSLPPALLSQMSMNIRGVQLNLSYLVPSWTKEPLLTVWQLVPVRAVELEETEECEECLSKEEQGMLLDLLRRAYKYKWTFEVAEASWQRRMLFWKGLNLILFACDKPWSYSCGKYPFSREIILNAPTLVVNLGSGYSSVGSVKATEEIFFRLRKHTPKVVALSVNMRVNPLQLDYPVIFGMDYRLISRGEVQLSSAQAKYLMFDMLGLREEATEIPKLPVESLLPLVPRRSIASKLSISTISSPNTPSIGICG